MGRYFILREGEVIEEPIYDDWAKWYESSYKDIEEIAQSQLRHSTVTTRFLALDMSLKLDEPAKVFETRVKGGWFDDQWERFSTLYEAQQGHENWVKKVLESEDEDQLPPPGGTW